MLLAAMHNAFLTPPALIALDCDGVILDSVDVKTRAFAAVAETFGAGAPERMVEYHLLHGGVSRQSKFTWLYRELNGQTIPPSELNILCERFAEYCREGVMNAPLIPGAMDFIQSASGILPLHVVSGTPEVELRAIFDFRGLSSYFRSIRGTPPEKIAMLKSLVKESGLSPERILMIGDSVTDLEAAEAAGTLFFGIGLDMEGCGWPVAPDLLGLAERIGLACGEMPSSALVMNS